jgi:hypothetical protein
MIEIYKDVIDYEGIYQVSNLGNVKSMKFNKEKILKPSKDSKGYLSINLSVNGVFKMRNIHQLVAESFLNHKRCGYRLVVNHLDFNKTNNNVSNLEIVSARENCNKKHLKSTSQYTGVHWSKNSNKWISRITINGKNKHLGSFNDELRAVYAYQKELLNIS